ncbi:IclR family KDG regulon transcriptional repressor [Neobacillus niacini]|uniref:IclR family transcriptional regulator n=1 Tax=Neobacillus niacini TaxID=86668 RepID=UPI00285CF771|nr:IclR family transcriptional regulator [Neobacillus niacini]MDR7080023.1 IclR family KDG regulon transcriptional repressor [Neobacillus niacini]
MEKKYWVPAIERANEVLKLLVAEPSQLRLIDISKMLGINKSSIFSLLNTMEVLGWVVKEKGDTYSLGPALGMVSAAYLRQFDMHQSFSEEALTSLKRVNETIQLSILDGRHIVYLSKEEGSSPIRVATDPGIRFPAHATAMGKVQLSQYGYAHLKALYPEEKLEEITPYTVKNIDQLWVQLGKIRDNGFIGESQEAVIGFYCIAAPIFNHENKIIAAVSFTMLENSWKEKYELARDEIIKLANRLSLHAGYVVQSKKKV